MSYTRTAGKRIKKADPIAAVERDIRELDAIIDELRAHPADTPKEALDAISLRIRATQARSKIHGDLMDKVVPSPQAVRLSAGKKGRGLSISLDLQQDMFQRELDEIEDQAP